MTLTFRTQSENSHSVRLISLDWSGVISDDRRPVYEANVRMLKAHGKAHFSFEEWLSKTTMTAQEFFAKNGISEDPKIIFEEYGRTYAQSVKEGIRPTQYPDAKAVLKFISENRIPIVIISSHPAEHLLHEAAEYGVKDYILSFEGNVTDKAEALLRVGLRMGIKPSDMVYLGDMVYDIRAAKKAGVCSVAVATGYHNKERLFGENPDLVVNSLTEFQNSFAKLLRS